ncbi:AraC family transcriptional regulator [Salmonella enterica subsp. enterica serovar Choleraesuis]|nr:AraC family transcriptional regulator [Salmonella enterica subsp. enterica serovar Choleraesuis]
MHQEIINSLLQWIDANIDKPLSIEAVARKSGYSKWYIQRMFRSVTHHTLADYIRQRRLTLAAEALKNTHKPIFDIAMDVGFASQQTFSRVFRREYATTPTDYRHHA